MHGHRLVDALRASKKVNLVHAREVPHYEHMDVVWARDAHDTVFGPIDNLVRERRASAPQHGGDDGQSKGEVSLA